MTVLLWVGIALAIARRLRAEVRLVLGLLGAGAGHPAAAALAGNLADVCRQFRAQPGRATVEVARTRTNRTAGSVVTALLFHAAINVRPAVVPVLPTETIDRACALVVATLVMTALWQMAGHHVLLRCAQVDVPLGHLRPGSVQVRGGDAVAAGVWLGAVGNSGNTGEPHLHVHAQRPGPVGAPVGGDPLPLTFNGRFPARGDRIGSP